MAQSTNRRLMSPRRDCAAKTEVIGDRQDENALELRSEWQQAMRLIERSQTLVKQSRHLVADTKMLCRLTAKLSVQYRSRNRGTEVDFRKFETTVLTGEPAPQLGASRGAP